MTFERRRRLAASGLIVAAVAGLLWLMRLDFAAKISTDVLDLIPTGERSPELALVRSLASEKEARTMLFVLTSADGSPAPETAADIFAAALRRSPVFAEAVSMVDTRWRDAAGRRLFELRFELLFPSWLQRQLEHVGADQVATRAAAELKTFLGRPEAVPYQDLVPADPLLLLPDVLQRLQGGVLAAGSSASFNGLIWARISVSPLREEGQQPAFDAIDRALVETRQQAPGIRVSYTGVNRFAAASRARIEREVSWLNALSLVAVLAVAAVFIRAVHRALHLIPVIAFSVLGAWVATTMAFDRVHVMVFVLGALLAGVAIDYGFYLFMQPPATDDEPYPLKVRRLAKPLIASCATTVAGFALLLLSEFPMIRQLGVFVGAGLVAALGAAVLYFACLRNTFLPGRERPRVLGASGLGTRAWPRRVLMVAWVVAVLGLVRVSWRDDIRELEVPAPDLQATDASIRARFGHAGDRGVYLTHGKSLLDARVALERFQTWVGNKASLANLGVVVPTDAARAAARQFFQAHAHFPEQLRAALEGEGFEASEFQPFFAAYDAVAKRLPPADIVPLVAQLERELAGPLGLLIHVGPDRNWFVSIADRALAGTPPPETQTVASSQLQSLNRLFAGYRASALKLSLTGLGLVGLGVLLTYGMRDGLRIFAIPCGACLAIFGLYGWLGYPLNLFHLLGAFLGVCLTHNYSIFSATSAYRHEPPPVSVRLSGLTTAASFGVLALSGIPVVQALGLTVSAMVLAALLLIELEHLAPLARRA